MTTSLIIDWFRELLWTAIWTAGPTIAAAVIIGLIMAILQAATQVHDASVAFAPKALVAAITLGVGGPWILRNLVRFASESISMIASL